MSQVASDANELSLQRLLLGFMKFAVDKDETSFPPFESDLWHVFLYMLKSDFERKFPELKCIGEFDWDTIFPKCREYDVAMFGLRYQCYSKFPGGRVFLNKEVRDNTSLLAVPPLNTHYPKLAEKMLELARQIPGFFEPR